MREIMKCLWKRKISNLLLLIQMVIALLFFFEAYAQYQRMFEVFQTVPDTVKVDTSDVVLLDIDDEIEQEDFQKYLQQLRLSGRIKNFSGYKNSWIESSALGSCTLDALHIENDLSWLRELQVIKGRNFQKADYDIVKHDGSKEKPYPTLLGSGMEKQYAVKVGDVFSDINNEYYQVVGVLQEKSEWFSKTLPEGRMVALDKQVVVAKTDQSKIFMNYYCQVTNKKDLSNILKQIESLGEQCGVSTKARCVSDILEQNYQTELRDNIMWISCALLVILFISIGTATLMTARIYARKTEIGIRKAVGFSNRRIAGLFVGEFIGIGIMAWILACLLDFYMLGGGVTEIEGTEYRTLYYFNRDMIWYGFLLTLLQIVPSCIIAVHKLGKLQPKNLI